MNAILQASVPTCAEQSDSGRRENDGYYTPPALANALVSRLDRAGWLPSIETPRVLEPSCGAGAFVSACRDTLGLGARITAIDLAPPANMLGGATEVIQCDFLDYADPTNSGFDLVIGNPPYGERVPGRKGKLVTVPAAERHVRHALGLLAPGGVLAVLLRLALLESKDRIPFWRDFPAESIYVLSERPSFSGGGTDNAAYAMFVWQNRGRGRMRTEVISWR